MSERVLLEGSPTLGVEEEVAVAGCASAMWMIAGGKEGSRDRGNNNTGRDVPGGVEVTTVLE